MELKVACAISCGKNTFLVSLSIAFISSLDYYPVCALPHVIVGMCKPDLTCTACQVHISRLA